MPELQLVVLALQDRLAYGPTFESAMAGLFGGAASSLEIIPGAAAAPPPAAAPSAPSARSAPAQPQPAAELNALIADAARDLADYQRLTAEGKLGEAGQRLEALKRKLEQLQQQRR